jgi:hypothetical protein
MSAEEEQFDESTTGAPGAPTPVGALEVRVRGAFRRMDCELILDVGCQWIDSARHQASNRRRLQHDRVNRLYVSVSAELDVCH